MAWSLGSLFVDFKVNTAQFLDGMSKASAYAGKTGRDIEKGLGKAGALLAPLGEVGERVATVLGGVGEAANEAFSSIGHIGGALGILTAGVGGATALGGAMFALAAHASEVGAKIFEASEKTGIGADKMSGLMALAKETGGDFESLSSSIAKAGVNLEKGIIDPGSKAGKVLAQVMGSARNLSDLGLKPVADRIQIVLAKIFAMNDPLQRNIALSTLMGKGWQSDVSALKLLAEQGYGPAIEQAKKFGIFFDNDAASKAKQFTVEMASLQSELSGVGLAMGQKLIPYLQEFVINMAGAIPAMESFGIRLLAIGLALTGQVPGAIVLWNEAGKKLAEANEISNQFAINAAKLADGQKAAGAATGSLSTQLKYHRDILADIIAREQDYISASSVVGGKQREARIEFDKTTQEIREAVKAGGSYAESLKAQSLALDVYREKLSQIAPVVPKLPESLTTHVAHGNNVFNEDIKTPELSSPDEGSATAWASLSSRLGGLGAAQVSPLLLSQIAQLPKLTEDTRVAERALRQETDLSSDSFKKLAAAFPGLTEGEVAATAAGQQLIDKLAKLDKIGNLSNQFKALKNSIIEDGDDASTNLVKSFSGAIGNLEEQFAHLAVTGKASFKSLYQTLGEQVVKVGIQKGVGFLTGHLGLHTGGATKRDGGTPQASVYVTPVSDSGKALGGINGMPGNVSTLFVPPPPKSSSSDAGGLLGGKLPAEFSSVLKGLSSSVGGAFNAFGSIGKSIGGIFGSLFGGFLAGGGDVTPGKAYIVGEKKPEWFIPGRSGHVAPSLSTQSLRPLMYSPTYNINTPNADSFRRTQSQVLAEGYRTMANSHAKNS